MIFRPSDDVLDQNGQVIPQTNEFVNPSTSDNNDHQLFHTEDENGNWVIPNSNPDNIVIPDVEMEEVKAPDLWDLLTKDNTSNTNQNPIDQPDSQFETRNTSNTQQEHTTNPTPTNEINKWNIENNTPQNITNWNRELEEAIPWKMADEERIKIVSNIEWSVHSNLDLLVDEQRYKAVIKYRKVHRIVFRRWLFMFSAFIWILIWTLFQVSAWESNNYQMIKDESIEDIGSWRVSDMPDVVLQGIKQNGVDVIIPYGSAKINGKSFQSKAILYHTIE